jgi:hypothetical protein
MERNDVSEGREEEFPLAVFAVNGVEPLGSAIRIMCRHRQHMLPQTKVNLLVDIFFL